MTKQPIPKETQEKTIVYCLDCPIRDFCPYGTAVNCPLRKIVEGA